MRDASGRDVLGDYHELQHTVSKLVPNPRNLVAHAAESFQHKRAAVLNIKGKQRDGSEHGVDGAEAKQKEKETEKGASKRGPRNVLVVKPSSADVLRNGHKAASMLKRYSGQHSHRHLRQHRGGSPRRHPPDMRRSPSAPNLTSKAPSTPREARANKRHHVVPLAPNPDNGDKAEDGAPDLAAVASLTGGRSKQRLLSRKSWRKAISQVRTAGRLKAGSVRHVD